MACITINIDNKIRERLSSFPWVNWSEIGREEVRKRYIFDTYLQTGKIAKDDQKFCEQIDWHPVDELPLREDFIQKMQQIRKGKFHKFNSIEELRKATSQ